MKFKFTILIASLALTLPAAASTFQVNVGPMIGGGSTTAADAVVRHASGVRLQVAPYAWTLPGHVELAPHLAVNYMALSTRSFAPESNGSASYEHRYAEVGLKVSYPKTEARPLANRVYLAASTGVGEGKLTMYRVAEQSFSQNALSGLSSRTLSSELGIEVPLKERFTLFAGTTMIRLAADQSKLVGSRKTETNDKGKLQLSSGVATSATAGLEDNVLQTVWAFAFGVNMGI